MIYRDTTTEENNIVDMFYNNLSEYYIRHRDRYITRFLYECLDDNAENLNREQKFSVLNDFIKNNSVDNIINQLNNFKKDLEKRKVTMNSIYQLFIHFRQYFKLINELDFIKWENTDFKKLMRFMKEIKSCDNVIKDVKGPSREEMESIFQAIKNEKEKDANFRAEIVIRLLYDCGLRVIEARKIQMKDINFNNQSIKIIPKGAIQKNYEIISVPSTLFNKIKEIKDYFLQEDKPIDEYYLISRISQLSPRRIIPTKKPLDRVSIFNILQKVLTSAKIEKRYSPHSFRHAAITHALDVGMGIREVRNFSRHKNVATIFHYDDARKESMKNVQNAIEIA